MTVAELTFRTAVGKNTARAAGGADWQARARAPDARQPRFYRERGIETIVGRVETSDQENRGGVYDA